MNKIPVKMPTIEDAKKAISLMFNGFNWSGDETEKKVKLASYWNVLGELPPSVIIAVCSQAARGELTDDLRFLPTSAQLYQKALMYLPKPVFQLIKPGNPEAKRVIPEDESRRVAVGLQALAAEFASAKAMRTALSRHLQIARESPPRAKTDAAKPLSHLSAEALASIGPLTSHED